MSSSKDTKSPQEIASEIIRRIEPEEVLEVLATGYEIKIEMRKDGIAIKTHKKGAGASWIELSKSGMILAVIDDITADSVEFWLGRFKNLLTAYKLKRL